MDREQFIKRLEEVGFYLYNTSLNKYRHDALKVGKAIYIIANKDLFTFCTIAYSFNELEQFLADKGIVEPKFDAHTYLLSKGYSRSWDGYHHPSASYKICIKDNKTEVSRTYRDGNTWSFEGITKESCDKAIGLIKYLESIE